MSEYVDTAAIQAVTGWARAYVWWLASTHHWRRRRTGRNVSYHWKDVAKTIEQQEAAHARRR